MRFLFSLLSTALLCYGAYFFWQNNPQFREFTQDFVKKQFVQKEFPTLEVRYTPEQIMEAHRLELLPSKKYNFLEPELKFYPYLLLDVKFSRSAEKTEEASMLWSLVDGEMVLDTKTWEKTHGYEDCINAGATKADFLILNLLANQAGPVEKKALHTLTGGDNHALENTVESCKRKKLLVEHKGVLRLHFESPKLASYPVTQFEQPLVMKSYKNAVQIARNYSASQIRTTAESAFSKDFTVRGAREVFLPVYTIEIQNPDGTVKETHWNAVNGKRMDLTPNAQVSRNPLQRLLPEK